MGYNIYLRPKIISIFKIYTKYKAEYVFEEKVANNF